MCYTILQTSWLPLPTKTFPDPRVWGEFQQCTIACTNYGSVPNLLTVRGLAKWLQLNLLLSTTPLLVPLLSYGAIILLVCYNVIFYFKPSLFLFTFLCILLPTFIITYNMTQPQTLMKLQHTPCNQLFSRHFPPRLVTYMSPDLICTPHTYLIATDEDCGLG